jgi:type II secretory pathway pseudopilin PulG
MTTAGIVFAVVGILAATALIYWQMVKHSIPTNSFGPGGCPHCGKRPTAGVGGPL